MIETTLYEDFFNPALAEYLERSLKEVPLYYNEATSYLDNETSYVDSKTKETIQFTHQFVMDSKGKSDWINVVAPAIDEIVGRFNIRGKMYRCKMNVMVPSFHHKNGEYVMPHGDLDSNHNGIVALYYLNDSDGNTIFFEDKDTRDENGDFIIAKEITPKRNSLAIFDAHTLHCNRPPMTTNSRWVINFLFSTDETL